MASKEVARFADKAMFVAEPIDVSSGPKVHLLWMTPDPLGAIAAACKMYLGEVIRDLDDVTDEERLRFLKQVTKTKLKAPFEFVKFHFMIEGVTRAFTHQLVRQRTAAYAQESLRFAVKEDMPVALPPSINVDLPNDADETFIEDYSHQQQARMVWEDAQFYIGKVYNRLIDLGVPAEDARGLLPHNVLTRIHYTTDLRALLDHAGNRLCTQAQFEWRIVFSQIAAAIRSAQIKIPGITTTYAVKMREELASLFAPVCYATGKCEFMADFDRHCSIRERVTSFHNHGISSDQWNGEGPEQIRPEEWLLNPNSARQK